MMSLLSNLMPILKDLGFRRRGKAWDYRRRHTSCRIDAGWLVLEHPAQNFANPLDGEAQLPGPWKLMQSAMGWTWSCELPLVQFASLHPDGGVLRDILTWPLGMLEDEKWTWTPPDSETIDKLVPSAARGVRCGRVTRMIETRLDADNLSFSLLLLPDGPRTPSVAALTQTLLVSWQRQWRMVRARRDGDMLVAEVDLTGAPAPALDVLVPFAIEALKGSLPALLPATELVRNDEPAIMTLAANEEWINATTTGKGG